MTYNIIYYETLGSTNDEAKKLAADGRPEGTVVISGAQTSGRGRLGKSWSSPASRGLYMSVVLRPQAPDVMKITVMAAVAVSRALDADIKWPNDIFINGKKVCGILCEAVCRQNGEIDAVIIGVGINTWDENFSIPDDLKDIAGTVQNTLSNTELANEIALEIIDAVTRGAEYFLPEYESRLIKPT